MLTALSLSNCKSGIKIAQIENSVFSKALDPSFNLISAIVKRKILSKDCCCSVTESDSSRPHGPHPSRFPWPSLSSEFAQTWWYHPTISYCIAPFSCPLSFPESQSFPMSQLFISDDLSTGASVSATVLPMNIQGWFPLGLTALISLLSKGLSRVFSITVWKHHFFSAHLSLWPNSHICTWLLEKP